MLHRFLVILIVGFWLTMTGLLVVRELYPESTGLNAIPVSYVGQLVFQHQQSSDLQIYSGTKEVGVLHVQARPISQPNKRELELHGNLSIGLPKGAQHRLSWVSSIEMTPQFAVERLHVDLSTQDPAHHLDIVVDCIAQTATFAVKTGDKTIDTTAVTLDEKGLAMLIAKAGLNPAMLQQIKSVGEGIPHPDFSAQTSSLVLSGEKFSTYLLTLKAGDQTFFEAHVSQLGQVLKAQSPLLGYKLSPFNIRP